MQTSLFNYHLPEEQIAQHSVEPRDHSRLMLLDRKTGEWEHKRFFEIVEQLNVGDVLVFNDTKVFRARLKGRVRETQREVEIFLLRAREGNIWEVLARPGKWLKTEVVVEFDGATATYVSTQPDGVVLMEFDRNSEDVIAFANVHGEIPIPPYVKEQPKAIEKYQTVYARETGSVAAPTAGFHFTQRLLTELKTKGVQFEFVTLHVGIGTFRPVKSATLEEHEMHSEFSTLDEATAARINQAKRDGRRVIAVGTTTVRTLEGIASHSPHYHHGLLRPYSDDINIFIKPGFEFKIIDGLITNFHLPKSTLLVLVSALADREQVLAAYEEAVKQGYRFFSFGDAMFIR